MNDPKAHVVDCWAIGLLKAKEKTQLWVKDPIPPPALTEDLMSARVWRTWDGAKKAVGWILPPPPDYVYFLQRVELAIDDNLGRIHVRPIGGIAGIVLAQTPIGRATRNGNADGFTIGELSQRVLEEKVKEKGSGVRL